MLLVGLGWGLLAPASKVLFGAPSFDGLTLAIARGAWAFPIFLIGLGVTWRLGPPRLAARHWAAIVAAGLIFAAITVIFSIAAQHTSVAHISFLLGISPVTNTAAAALIFRTPLGRRDWIALGLGVAGVVLLAVTHSNDRASFLGDALMIGWLVLFAAYACALRYVSGKIKTMLLMCLVGAISMGALLVGGVAAGWDGAIGHVADSAPIAWWFFGEVVLGSTLVAQSAFTGAVRRMGVALATIGAEYTALAVGVAASLVAHESWTPLTVIAGLIFCAALAATFVPVPTREETRSAA